MTLIPTVLDETARGDRAYDIYSLFLRERIVFLGQEVDDQIANLLIAELLYLDSVDAGKDIYLYINSPGGLAYAGMAMYDTMQQLTSARPAMMTVVIFQFVSVERPLGSLIYLTALVSTRCRSEWPPSRLPMAQR
jgi:ATP-dependent Clp protease protease subunit